MTNISQNLGKHFNFSRLGFPNNQSHDSRLQARLRNHSGNHDQMKKKVQKLEYKKASG